MTITINQNNSVLSTTGDALRVGTFEDVIVLATGYLQSTVADGLDLLSSNAATSVYVSGRVAGGSNAVGIVLEPYQSAGFVQVTTGGTVTGGGGIWSYGNIGIIVNNGTIQSTGFAAIFLNGNGSETVDNIGSIIGAGNAVVHQYGSTFALNNTDTGRIQAGTAGVSPAAISCVFGSTDTINNAGTIVGAVSLYQGADKVYVLGNGSITGTVDMGAGADTVSLEATARINGRVYLGSENDKYEGGNLKDDVNGGTGYDTISGGGGGDVLAGFYDTDTIKGGAGADTIIGGAARDSMWGGSVSGANDGSRDTFAFNAVSETSAAFSAADIIWDFNAGTAATADRISLSAIDAKSATTANDAFTWIGTVAFSGVAGQLRQQTVGGYTMVSGDVNGDKVADFAIDLLGIKTLAATDFIL